MPIAENQNAKQEEVRHRHYDNAALPKRVFSLHEKRAWRRAINDIYARMRAKCLDGPYGIQCDDTELTVLPNVYAPLFFTDSQWFARELPQIVGGGSLLEIGTGTGVIAMACAQNGARVVATDINPDAAVNARLNVACHGLDIEVREGDMYSPLVPGERFDFIFWAHPFNNWPTPVTDMLLRSGMDYRYEGVSRYIQNAKHHLKCNGKLLLGTGDSADLTRLGEIAGENAYRVDRVTEAQMPLEEGGRLLITYLICEFIAA